MEALKERPQILKLVENVAIARGLENYEITNVQENDKGEGFLSQIYLITIEDKKINHQLHIAVKASFNDEVSRSTAALLKCGENEIYFYSIVYPAFEEFLKSKGIQEIEFVPKCYKTYLGEQEQLLCFENLKKANFEVFDKKQALDHEHISLIFETYGKFHAISYALRDQEPEKFKKISDGLYNLYAEWVDDKSSGFTPYLRESSKLAHKYLIPGEDDEIIEQFETYLGNGIVDIFRDIVTQEDDFQTITHGDCWSNNMLFKYTNNNSKQLRDMRLLDIQLVKLGSPVCDLSYCLYSGSSKEIFDNLKEYLNIYYESFSDFMEKLGSDPKKLFPYDVLVEQWKNNAKFGMIMALLILKIKATEKEDIKDRTDGLNDDELLEAFVNGKFDEKTFQKRVRELLRHLSEIQAL